MKTKILYIIILTLLCLTFLQAGYIVRDIERDDTRERVISLKDKFQNHEGRIVVLEGPPKSQVKGKGKVQGRTVRHSGKTSPGP